jgi:prepilin-type N-terminal cleavage/methylation domain-containing protein
MNKLLPKTKSNQNGFTLVELLVVIVILAILGVIGVTIFTGTQSKARDAKRKEDITAMASAMEANYVPGTGYPTAIVATWFADGAAPTNPAPPAGGVYSTNTMTTAAFTFCTPLENTTGNATSTAGAGMTGITNGGFFCKKNAQ